MPKMTTVQFLSHLGIEVGKPFMCEFNKDCKYMIVDDDSGTLNLMACQIVDGKYDYSYFDIRELLDIEITPLPKYTLTEDEKAIVRNMSDKIDFLGKDGANLYGQIEGREPFWLPFNDVFNFIGQGINGELSLDELRKCL